ncbi:hypothetical protein AgCh_017429 [Apium graveolens]
MQETQETKKDKAYLELEAKYEALLRKQQSKAYIVEGKSSDDSENDEDEEFGNYAFMALEQGESSSSKSKTPTLTTIDLNMNQYKETVEKISTEMFHIHTSMVAANEEVSRLTKINEKLESEKQETELLLVELEALKQEVSRLTKINEKLERDRESYEWVLVVRGRKKIFRYLKETPNLGLWYPKGTSFEAVGYTDADFAGYRIDRKKKQLGDIFTEPLDEATYTRLVDLGLPTKNLVEVPTPDELIEFLDFINYSGRINLSSLNRTNLRKEWSFIFDSVVRAFTCRKTGYDNISSVVQKMVYSIAHNKHLNVGLLILKELATRLTMPLSARGKEIFFPRFIMSTLNNKVVDIHPLNGIDSTKLGNCKKVSKIIFGLLTKNKVNASLKITPFMLERFRTYPYPMPYMRSNAQYSTSMIPEPVEETKSSSSQKGEVSKKKRKGINLAVKTESGEERAQRETPLVKRSKRSKQTELTTLPSSTSSQQDPVVKTTRSESAQPAQEAIQVYGMRNKEGRHREDTLLEISSSIQGELPTLTTEQQILITKISFIPTPLESTSQVQQKSSDLAQEALLTTQTLHLDGERLHIGVDLDDTITNMGDSSFLLKTPWIPLMHLHVQNSLHRLKGTTPLTTLADIVLAVEARSTIVHHPVIGEESIAHSSVSVLQDTQRFEAGVHDSNPVKSSPIQLEWLQESASQPTSVDNLLVEQISGLANISQHLLTSNMSNQDYQAIMLAYNEEIEEQKEKIVNDAEPDGNVDAWLSDEFSLEMNQVLARFREEYVTILGNNAKYLSPEAVYDAITDVYKAQLKAFHLFGKALEIKLIGHEDRIRKLVNEKMDKIIPSQVQISSKFKNFTEEMARMDLASIEKKVKNLKLSFTNLHTVIQQQITHSNETKVQLDQLHQSRYKPPVLLMEGIKHVIEENFGTSSSSYQPGSTSTNLQIQSLQGQITTLQDSNSSLTAQVQALTPLVKSQQTDIQILVDSQKHLQIQNSIALGAIMGKLNIPLPSLPEQQVQGAEKKSKEVDLDMERFIRSAKGPSLSREFEELLKALKASLNNNHFTYKKAIDKKINFIGVIKVNKDNFLEEKIVVNANDSGTDRCMQMSLNCLVSRRASELDIFISKVRIITREDTILLTALRDAQKKNDQNPSGSNPSQSSKPSGSKGREKKKEDDKKDEEKNRRDEDHFQHLAKEIVRVWIVSLREVRVYFKDEKSFENSRMAYREVRKATREIRKILTSQIEDMKIGDIDKSFLHYRTQSYRQVYIH